MKTKFFTLILSVLLVGTFSQVANAGLLTIENLASEAERDAILASDDTSITATAVIRAGGGNTYELGIGDGDTLSAYDNLTWNINGDNSFTLSYDNGSGNYDLGVTPFGGSAENVSVRPTDYYNQILFSFESGGIEIDFNGTVNGEAFSTYNSTSAGQWDGVVITFPDSTSGSVESFTITGTMSMSTPLPDLGGDEFRGEFYLIKNEAVPEPATIGLLGLSGAIIWFIRRAKRL